MACCLGESMTFMEGLYDRRVPGYLMKPFTDSGNAVEISKDTKKSQKEHYLLQNKDILWKNICNVRLFTPGQIGIYTKLLLATFIIKFRWRIFILFNLKLDALVERASKNWTLKWVLTLWCLGAVFHSMVGKLQCSLLLYIVNKMLFCYLALYYDCNKNLNRIFS